MTIKYLVKRIFYAILSLLVVSLILYILMRLLPVDYIDRMVAGMGNGTEITPEQIQELKAIYGLDDNSFGGIISGYFNWLGNAIQGNLGMSFCYNEPVTDAIQRYMWQSFAVAIVAFVLEYIIAVPLGVKAATSQYSVYDYTITVITVIGISLPSFFVGTILIKIFATDLGWFPGQGTLSDANLMGFARVGDMLYHMILPMITIVLISLGGIMRHTRTNTLEVLNADYIRTARAKGLSERTVVYKHVFRNTMIPLVTMMAGLLPGLFGGMMILEEVFAFDGIGRISYQAMQNGDVPFIMGYMMFLAILTVIGTFLTDIAYMLVDPRVKLEK